MFNFVEELITNSQKMFTIKDKNLIFDNEKIKDLKNSLVKDFNNYSCVWFLVYHKSNKNEPNENKEIVIQVGRNKSVNLMFKGDIIPDIDATENKNNKRYGKYGNLLKDNDSLTFYFVKIDEYLKNDNEIKQILREKVPEDNYLKGLYHYNKAAWVEGKIGAYSRALFGKYDKNTHPEGCRYNPNGADKFSFDFYTDKIKKSKNN